MGASWLDFALGGVSAGMGLLSAAQSAKSVEAMNAANMQIAREQMSFQERMSGSAHQREVADLRAAGLNPILSGTGGSGASTPMGAAIPMQAKEAQSSLIRSTVANVAANTAKAVGESNLLRKESAKAEAETRRTEIENEFFSDKWVKRLRAVGMLAGPAIGLGQLMSGAGSAKSLLSGLVS